MDLITTHFRNRFVSDQDLPIQLKKSPWFEDKLELLEPLFGAKTKYDDTVKLAHEKFGGLNEFLEYYGKTRETIINETKNSDAYVNRFTTGLKYPNYIAKNTPKQKEVFTQNGDGCFFLSLDMKRSNYQMLRSFDKDLVFGTDTYEDFIGKFTDLDYIKNSRYTRQVIFGQLNPKWCISTAKHVTTMFADELCESFGDAAELWSIKNDEIIFKFRTEEELKNFRIDDFVYYKYNGVDIQYKVEKFKLVSRVFNRPSSDSSLVIYEKRYLNGKQVTYHCIPVQYYAQVYKLLNGMVINDNDLTFYYEHEVCKFLKPLELVK